MLAQIDTDTDREIREIRDLEDLKEISSEYGEKLVIQFAEKLIKIQAS